MHAVHRCGLVLLETFVIIALYKSTFTIPYHNCSVIDVSVYLYVCVSVGTIMS